MTELIYQTDSYVKEFEATVTAHDQASNAVILNRTAFYPGGGGQPADHGVLIFDGRAFPVTRVRKAGENVLHLIEGALPPVGAAMQGQIDWDHRYKLMRTHTAMHILCAVAWRDYGVQVTGSDMESLKGRMDFEFEDMRQELVREIEQKINAEVQASRETRVAILPREQAFQIPDLIRTKINLLPKGITQVRTLEIIGLDLQADGGTHVRNTKEVGTLRVVDYKSKGKINKRIYFEVED